ncbi:MAG: TatD family hydrolase [Lachnospiraceae bacterium]|nr:TatD family hydrolase [Lachnospiraceae bacterium]
MIFDTHAHYDDEQFDIDREIILQSMAGQGIGYIVNVGASMKSSAASVKLSENYPFIYAAVGVHPNETGEMKKDSLSELKTMALKDKSVAVGEIGLDYHYMEPDEKTQKYWFEAQLDLAAELQKPVIIHSRDAAKDTMDIMKKYTDRLSGGVIHCYSYSRELALEYAAMGYYIGVGGVLTFSNGKKLAETVMALPLNQIVLETDCPYLSPEPFRGKRNESSRIHYIAERMAELLGRPKDDIVRITCGNALKMYHLS